MPNYVHWLSYRNFNYPCKPNFHVRNYLKPDDGFNGFNGFGLMPFNYSTTIIYSGFFCFFMMQCFLFCLITTVSTDNVHLHWWRRWCFCHCAHMLPGKLNNCQTLAPEQTILNFNGTSCQKKIMNKYSTNCSEWHAALVLDLVWLLFVMLICRSTWWRGLLNGCNQATLSGKQLLCTLVFSYWIFKFTKSQFVWDSIKQFYMSELFY